MASDAASALLKDIAAKNRNRRGHLFAIWKLEKKLLFSSFLCLSKKAVVFNQECILK